MKQQRERAGISVLGAATTLQPAPDMSLLDTTGNRDSWQTENTLNTFIPPLTSSGEIDDEAFIPPMASMKKKYIEMPLDEFPEVPVETKPPRPYTNKEKIILIVILLGTVSSAALLGLWFTFLKTEESTEEIDFCASVGQSDQEAREILANIDILEVGDYSDRQDIKCLPANAFEALSEEQVSSFKENTARLSFSNCQELSLLHKDAFADNIFENIQSIVLDDTPIIEFPDRVFEPFIILRDFQHRLCLYSTLDNNIFGSSGENVEIVDLTACEDLEALPLFLKFTPNVEEIDCVDCRSLSSVNGEELNLPSVVLLNLLRTAIPPGTEDIIAEELGIDIDNVDIRL